VTLILFRVDVTSDVHLLDFNKRILILKMHGANIENKYVYSSSDMKLGLGKNMAMDTVQIITFIVK
jgi:hypothetical protein